MRGIPKHAIEMASGGMIYIPKSHDNQFRHSSYIKGITSSMVSRDSAVGIATGYGLDD
jgi:hypothetical protein